MRVRCSPLLLPAAALLLAAFASIANVNASPDPNALSGPSSGGLYPRQHSHSHSHAMSEPLLDLNETDILRWHKPTPPSYGTHDFEDPSVEHKYPHLMALHALFMSLAFFGALPISIALRSVNHSLHGVSVAAFYGSVVFGLACSGLYRKLTRNMYENAKHGPHGYFVLLFAIILTTIDVFAGITRAFCYVAAIRRRDLVFSLKGLWRTVVLNKESSVLSSGTKAYSTEYAGLVSEPEDFEMDVHELKGVDDVGHVDPGLSSPSSEHGPSQWVNDQHTIFRDQPMRHDSRHSDETLHEVPRHIPKVKQPLIQRIGKGVFATSERILVVMGYVQVISGLVTYTGICRDSWINGCLAHLIKGGIFWCYGLFSFARFLGSFSELGWAWNRSPRTENIPSPEFVESFLIFIYGITNTWMERFGAHAGDPYTTKQIQHISIAVMFWFAGLVGMGIESRTIRRWIDTSSSSAADFADENDNDNDRGAESRLQASYDYRSSASFNPFPALVIGVTGLAMAAHAQVYLFQVQIHVLWGSLLALGAILRCLTYFFLFVSPPSHSSFSSQFSSPPRPPPPSRPPTEALTSFFITSGGLMFQLSTEEIGLGAMRRGLDDRMMFLCFVVGVVCVAFVWVLGGVGFGAWVRGRGRGRVEVRGEGDGGTRGKVRGFV